MIIVTDYNPVDIDDFYLTDKEWIKNNDITNIEELRELAKAGRLYEAYEVEAECYAIYGQMDAEQVFIDYEDNILMICESAVIGNKYQHCFKSD